MRWPHVFLVTGPSSAGKTTLCRALQAAITEPYLVTAFDDFIFMSAPRYYRGADTARQSELDAFTARFGPVFRRLLDAMAPAVRALVDGGNPVIFDHVLHDSAMHESCVKSFAGLDVFAIGVTCPVEILEARERARGDRVLGRARGLAEVVHTFMTYDLIVDTGAMSPQDCAAAILKSVEDR